MTPILSIVNVLRNDDYDEFMSYKLNIILKIYDSLFKLIPEKKVELLFVDWGSRKPILNSLQISKFLSKQISYFYIPPQKQKALIQESFPVAQAVNFGLEKSRAVYHDNRIRPISRSSTTISFTKHSRQSRISFY